MESLIQKTYTEKIIEDIKKIETDTLIFLVDHNVWAHYSKTFNINENFKDKKIILWKGIDGEKVKNFKEYESCLEFLLEKGVQRNGHIIAIGGGSMSDFAGFVAATLLRGISWSVIPTSLLAMVDAAIGGKVAINSKHGKNLIGAFYYPQNVWINTEFLETLPEAEKSSGKGEVLKYCFLDKQIYEAVVEGKNLDEIIMLCAQYKEKVTQEDYKEKGNRKFLNFGHTFGHAFEKHYGIAHGQAVILGIAVILFIENRSDLLKNLQLLAESLSVSMPEVPWLNRTFPLTELMEYIRKDKKSISTKNIELIQIKEVGYPEVVKKTFTDLEEQLNKRQDELRQFSL